MTRWESSLDPASLEAVLTKNSAAQPRVAGAMDAFTVDNLKRVKQRAGWLEPQTQLA